MFLFGGWFRPGRSRRQLCQARESETSWQIVDLFLRCTIVPDGNGYGRLVINTDNHSFTFIGQDFTPNQQVHIKTETDSGFELIAKGKSTKSGNLHIQARGKGLCQTRDSRFAYYDYLPAYGFSYSNRGYYVAHVKVKWSNDGGVTWHTTSDWGQSVAINEDVKENIRDIDPNIPVGSLVKFKLSVVWGDDVIADEIYKYVDHPGICYPYYVSFGGLQSAWLLVDGDSVSCFVGGYWCGFPVGCYFDY